MKEKEELRIIIIEDEEPSRMALASLLKEFCPEVKIEASVASLTEARYAILRYAPDAVFLDVEIPPEGTGFDLLESIHPSFLRFGVIFTTGHQNYAFQAFRSNAVDFLTKPVDPDELITAVNKIHLYKNTKRLQEAGDNVQNLLKEMSAAQSKGIRLTMPSPRGMRILYTSEVAFFGIDEYQTEVQFANGELLSSPVTIEMHTQELISNGFIQTSNKSFVNTAHVQYVMENPDRVILKNGHAIPIAPPYIQLVSKRFGL